MTTVPPVPPFRDLLDPDAPPFPAREVPAETPPPERPSLLARWSRLPSTVQGLILGGLALAVAVGILLTPEARSVEYIPGPTPPTPSPDTINASVVRTVPEPVEAPLPSWYMTAADVPLNTRMTADVIKRLLRTQPGKPLPPNAITDVSAILGKYAIRPISANATVTPADFADAPLPPPVSEPLPDIVWLSIHTIRGVTEVPFLRLPGGGLEKLALNDPRVLRVLAAAAAPLPAPRPRAGEVTRAQR